VTDPQRVASKLALIETRLRELRTLAKPSLIGEDVLQERFVEYTLQTAIQAALDVASHIVSEERLGEPVTNRDLFALLTRAELLDRELGERLQAMAGFRNILVHGYDEVNLALVRGIVENRLGDLVDFVTAIRAYLSRG
jgi:uncharacterized protein YutE (UPF0331/DUF86 family)